MNTKEQDKLEQEEQGIIGLNGRRYVTDAPGLPEGLTLYKPNEGSGGENNTGSKAGGSYSYAQSAPSYANRYQSVMDQAANALLNRKAFTYDSANDPMYQQYKDSYTRQGKQAMEDTLAQVSARTGGLASSYAGTAAQQTYNNYMSALADKVPELRQLAYEMYMDEGDTMRANLQMLQGLEQTDYSKYLDALGQWNTNRQFDYNAKWDEDGRTYDRGQDALKQAQTQVREHIAAGGKVAELPQKLVDASGYSLAQLATWEKEFADAKSLAAAQLMEGTGNYSRYKELLGLTDEEVAALGKWHEKQNAPKVTGDRGEDLSMTLATAKAMAKQGQFTDDVLRVLRNAGFNDEYLKLEYGYEPELEDEQPYSPPPAVTNGEYGESYDATMRAVGHSLNVKDPKSALPGIIKWLEENNPSLTTEGWDLIYGYIEQKTGVPVEQW